MTLGSEGGGGAAGSLFVVSGILAGTESSIRGGAERSEGGPNGVSAGLQSESGIQSSCGESHIVSELTPPTEVSSGVARDKLGALR